MKERPILFSAAMVRALLAGQKTQTRRVVKPQPEDGEKYPASDPWLGDDGLWRWMHGVVCREQTARRCPYGQPGDRLWVRESWNAKFEWPEAPGRTRFRWLQDVPPGWRGARNANLVAYAADRALYDVDAYTRRDEVSLFDTGDRVTSDVRWRPSIHMPRWASRLSLELTGVRVERVQDIGDADSLAEGIDGKTLGQPPRLDFANLWNQINARRRFAWDSNPWVWVLEFKLVDAEPARIAA